MTRRPGRPSTAEPRLAIHGAGRMGQGVARAAALRGWPVLGLVARHHPGESGDIPRFDIPWFPGLEALEGASGTPDVLIDFSLPAGTVAAARWCAEHRVPLVTGTTGLDATQDASLDRAGDTIPVLHASNFSRGVNALAALLDSVRELLPEIDHAQLTDVHHVHKKDAPSGTALDLARALAPLEVEINSLREGEVVGEHTVELDLPGETLVLAHHAKERGVFAHGAVEAADWLRHQAPGRYTAQDWIRSGLG